MNEPFINFKITISSEDLLPDETAIAEQPQGTPDIGMARAKTMRRLETILDAASETFLELGYRGARVEEVARRAGVSAGTVYLYTENKDALFELVLRRAFREALPRSSELPFRATASSDLVGWMWNRLQKVSPFPALRRAAAAEATGDAMEEFDAVVEEVWDWHATYWEAVELLERCARDWPELHMLFYLQFRRELLALASVWLERRMEEGALRRYPDAPTAVRVIGENVAFFAMHRHVRPDSEGLDEETCKETVLKLLHAGFAP